MKMQTRRLVERIFQRLDYKNLGRIYCDEGGDAFWADRRVPCRRLGVRIAQALQGKLPAGGRSLYVGAGVAEIPALVMESLELGRTVVPLNLRRNEVRILNEACRTTPVRFRYANASNAKGCFDHLWAVSVFNDPERFPHLSALSYGRANLLTFDPKKFCRERREARGLAAACLRKLTLPAVVTTSVEEIVWITDWCARRGVAHVIENDTYQSAIVGDPICLIHVGIVA